MVDIYLMEEMDSHLFSVIKNTGQVVDKVDVLSAEGLDYRLSRSGLKVVWLDRGAIKERKYVRNLISQYCSSDNPTPVRVSL